MSLGLVSYEDSDESDNDIESSDTIGKNTISKNVTVQDVPKEEHVYNSNIKYPYKSNERENFTNESENTVNFNLPQSNKSLLNTDIDIKCLTSTSKKNGLVKIAIPSLSEIEDKTTEEPSKKKLKPSQKGSGLFALLPSPKSSLVPQAVTNRNRPIPNKKPNLTKKTVPTAPTVVKTSLISYEDSEDEEETSSTVDFFSLAKGDEVVATHVDDFDIGLSVSEPTVPTAPIKDELNASQSNYQSMSWEDTSNSVPSASGSTSSYPTDEFMNFNNSNLELDDEAMQQLCGRRDRLKRHEVNIIDVSGDTLMPDSREWLTKQLTEEQTHRTSHKKRDGPTSQQKRKHQITYLAFQAKESELELKNQWANNRLSRKQTQSKYGF